MSLFKTYSSKRYVKDIINNINYSDSYCPECGKTLYDLEVGAEDDILIILTRKIRIDFSKGIVQIYCNLHKGWVEINPFILSKIKEKC